MVKGTETEIGKEEEGGEAQLWLLALINIYFFLEFRMKTSFFFGVLFNAFYVQENVDFVLLSPLFFIYK